MEKRKKEGMWGGEGTSGPDLKFESANAKGKTVGQSKSADQSNIKGSEDNATGKEQGGKEGSWMPSKKKCLPSCYKKATTAK